MMRSMHKRLQRDRLARNTLWLAGGQTLRVLVQGLYFVALARALGASGYGAFVGVLSLVGAVTPFASLGTGALMVKNTARDRAAFRRYWGSAIVTSVMLGGVLLIAVLAGQHWLLPSTVSLVLVLGVAASDLIFLPLLELSGQAYQAFERLKRTAQIFILWSALKLVAAGALFLGLAPSTQASWGVLYVTTTIVAAAASVRVVVRELGAPILGLVRRPGELKEGAYFSIGGSARTLYDDIDKVLLARLTTLEATGTYGAAYRIIDLAFLPVMSLLQASFAGFFQHGARGLRSALRYAAGMIKAAFLYGVLAGIGLYLAAGLIPFFLGPGYAKSVDAVRWLAPLPFLKSVHYFAANGLSGSGHQGWRTAAQVIVATVNVALNLWLIPVWSWRGAAWASLVSDGLLAVSLWTIVWYLANRETDQDPERPQAVPALGQP